MRSALTKNPTVIAALAWLLDQSPATVRHRVVLRARSSGLLRRRDDGDAFGGAIATRLIARPGKSLPQKPRELGRLLHGLGEIAARSHAQFSDPLDQMMRKHRTSTFLHATLEAALECASAEPPRDRYVVEISGFVSWMTVDDYAWESFRAATGLIDYHWYPPLFPDYGLAFAAEHVMASATDGTELRGLPRLTTKQYASVGSGAVALATSARPSAAIARSLVRTPFPGLRHLGAAAVVMPRDTTANLTDARGCCATLVRAGIARGDAVWMTGYRLKMAVHERYRLTGRVEQAKARLAELTGHPDRAVGGHEHYAWEIETTEEELSQSLTRLEEVDEEIGALLRGLADAWPAEGLDDAQLAHLDMCFVGTPEIRHRLAVQVPHDANRRWLLRKTLETLEEHLGLRDPQAAAKDWFHPGDHFIPRTVPWAARSAAALFGSERPSKGIGRETSRLVAKMAAASEDIAERPFAATRWPTNWMSLILRGACADYFALAVAETVPQEDRAEVEYLAKAAIEHGAKMLTSPLPDDREAILLNLTSLSLHVMAWHSEGEALRQHWVDTPRMAAQPRALVLWATPALVDRDLAAAETVFLDAIAPPLSREPGSGKLSVALTILDAAMAASTAAGRADLTARLVVMWEQSIADWPNYAHEWREAARTWEQALQGHADHKRTLLEDEKLKNSRCRALVVERQEDERTIA